ncbi:TauD/TfdA family dioxygenase [Chloroflexi bacterium TSY]|nr:TauD/TfdA family dioxygenase [Chloroflexi bacterium TSY]
MYRMIPIDDPAAWRGADLTDAHADWTVTLTAEHVTELETAMHEIRRRAFSLFDIQRDDFPLPTLSGVLSQLLNELEGGRGFVRLRGLPTTEWGEEKSRFAIWGIGTHLGWAEPQDGAGNLLHDVRDIGRKFGSDDTIRYYQTNQAIDFHNDGADIFALCCLTKGRRGGRSLLISAVELFNEVARQRPDLAEVLQQDFHVDARGQHNDGARCQVTPIYTYHNGLISILIKVPYIHSAQRFDDTPRLTQSQTEALDLLDSLMQDKDLVLEFDLEPGDTLIASNHTVLHGRTGFVDDAETTQQRHMLRLWLTIPNGRPLPAHYADTREFAATYARRM